MAETSYIIQNGRRLNLKDSTARKTIGSCDELQTEAKHCLVHAINELNEKVGSGGGGGGGGTPGKDGEDGATFTPSVDSEGNLSWTNDKGLENPETVNIKGPKGDKGNTGDTGASGANATINGVNTLIIQAGSGISLSQSGNVLTITASGGGGGFCPKIVVTAPTGSTVTCKKGDTVLNAEEVNRTWTFNVTEYGEWTVAGNGRSVVVPVDTVKQYNVPLFEYIVLQHIQSTGTQYIDTGWKPAKGDTLTIESSLSSGTSEAGFAGYHNQWELYYESMKINAWSSGTTITATQIPSGTVSYNQRNTVQIRFDTAQSSGTAYLFAYKTDSYPFNGRIYSAVVKNSAGTIIRNFYPAKRNSDGVVGLYDLKNSKFYTNAGSGTFTAGAETGEYL